MGVVFIDRMPLDSVVGRVGDREFVARHRRELTLRATGMHASPVMLAATDDGSMYVRAWRRHAARCDACRQLFDYFGLSVE